MSTAASGGDLHDDRPTAEPVAVRPGEVTGTAVRDMFSAIAGRYDLLNTVLSMGLDALWRHEAAGVALEEEPGEILDAATGTGALALALKRRRPQARVVGLDFARPMLDLAAEKSRRTGLEVELVQGDVLELPFPSASFDVVTIAYGLRNLADVPGGLSEIHRVLRPQGRVVILEFPPPPSDALGRLFRFYFSKVLPRVGGWISGSRTAYEYLPESVLAFPSPPELASLIREAGFTRVRYRLQSSGVSAIFVGEKRE